MPVYLVYLLVFFVTPVVLLGWALRRRLHRYRRTILWPIFFVFTLGAVWDWVACRTDVWRYDTAPTLGIWIGGIPVEEFIGFYVFGTLLLVGVTLLLVEGASHV